MTFGIVGRYLIEPTSGYGRNIGSFLPALSELDVKNNYIIFTHQKIDNELISNLGPNFQVEIVPESMGFLGKSIGRTWWEQFDIPKAAQKFKVDLLHYPFPTMPLNKQKFPVVVTINNVIPWKFKEFQGLVNKARQYFKVKAFKNASKIITVSRSSREDIIGLLGISGEKIISIYPGKNPIFKPGVSESQVEIVKKRYGIERPFIFYVGSFDLRKNLKRLIEVFGKIAPQFPNLELVLGGGVATTRSPYSFSFEELAYEAHKANISSRVKFIRLIPTEDLLVLYNLSSLFVYPSIYEGFVTSIIEAMACGTNVAASYIPAIAEIIDNSRTLFDPVDEEQMASIIKELLQDDKLRQEMRNMGIKRAAEFSWRNNAFQTLSVYQDLLKRI